MGGRGFRRYGYPTIGVAGGGDGIVQRALTAAPANLVALFPLNETGGTTVYCTNNVALSVASGYSGVTLNQPGPYGLVCLLADGINDRTNIYSAAFAAAFGGTEGTFGILAKMSASAVWADGAIRYLFHVYADANNYAAILKSSTANRITYNYKAGGTEEFVTLTTSSTAWNLYVLTWSDSGDAVKAYLNNAQTGTTQTGIGTWSGAPSADTTVIGALNTTPTLVHSGWLSSAFIFNKPLSLAEIQYIYGGGPG